MTAGGSIGDLRAASDLRRYPPHVTGEDAETSMRSYDSTGDHRLPAVTVRTFVRRLACGSAVGFGVLAVAAIASALLLALPEIQSFALGVPDTPWIVFASETGPMDTPRA